MIVLASKYQILWAVVISERKKAVMNRLPEFLTFSYIAIDMSWGKVLLKIDPTILDKAGRFIHQGQF